MKKHARSLAVILATKYEYLKKIYDIFYRQMKNLDPKYQEIIDSIDINIFEHVETKKYRESINKLTYLRTEADYLIRSDEKMSKHEEIILAKNSVAEMDSAYRMYLANYNADIIGYNYWIRFLPNRYIFLIFKIPLKETI